MKNVFVALLGASLLFAAPMTAFAATPAPIAGCVWESGSDERSGNVTAEAWGCFTPDGLIVPGTGHVQTRVRLPTDTEECNGSLDEREFTRSYRATVTVAWCNILTKAQEGEETVTVQTQ